jgi:hypothetical protein
MPQPPSRQSRVLCVLLVSLPCAPAAAAPLLTVDQNPLTAVYGLPLPQDARLPQKGSTRFEISTNLSNTLNIDASTDELLFIDGETHRINLVVDRGLGQDWSLRLLLPWVEHVPGFLDQPIDSFHETFNFQQGERPTQPRDRLLYFIRRDGDVLLHIDSRRAGVGDLQLMLNRQLQRTERSAYALSAGLKAPSGEAAKLTGSGATDVSLWASAYWELAPELDGSASAGLLFAGRGEILAGYQVDRVAFGHAGLQWRALPATVLKIQFDWHTGFYENMNSAFLSDVLQFSCGGTWRMSQDTELDFSITEDIKVDASPDVNFNINLRFHHE